MLSPLLRAQHHFDLADQILNKLLPLTDEPKLMLQATTHLALAAEQLELHAVQRREPINADIIERMSALAKILEAHKNAPIEFRRREAFVLADDRFNLTVLKKDVLVDHLDALRKAALGANGIGQPLRRMA
jgi:hypothetical protein